MSDNESENLENTEPEEITADDPVHAPGDVDVDGDEDTIIDTLQQEVTALKDRLMRSVAESENVRRRAEKDRADAAAYAVTSFARDILSVSDNLRRALESLPDDVDEDLKAFTEGVSMTERELLHVFERHGVVKFQPDAGEKFDPTRHQAMFEVPTADIAAGHVVQVVSSGYAIKDRLLRPAMVGVAKANPEEAPKVDTSA